MQKVISKDPLATIPDQTLLAARVSFVTTAASLLLLVALHVLRPDLSPVWNMVSQYAIGPFGWVQTLVFLTLAISCLSLFVAIRTQVRTRGGKIGLGFLIAATVGIIMAAMFNWEHPLHGVASIIGVPSLSTATLLISFSVARDQSWASVRRLVLWLGVLPWISFILMLGTLFATVLPSGEFGPGVLVGLPNRLLFLAWYCWLMVMALQTINVGGQESS
jgi:hypothetical protein